ncbi:MAG: TonB family protein, partial [Candidatus Zixiibacteriota bacterium]
VLGDAARYVSVTGDLPERLNKGARDSILIALTSPNIVYPTAGKEEVLKAIVWLLVTVGEKGSVVGTEVVDCTTPGFGFEEAAQEAMKDMVFMPLWEGPDPVRYLGYFPIPFVNPGPQTSRPRRRADIRGVGLDAPVVTPLTPPEIEYPPKALEMLVEGKVTLRLLINEQGKVAGTWVEQERPSNQGFGEVVKKGMKEAAFPIKRVNGQAVQYSAYTTTDFTLPAGRLAAAGLPLQSDEKSFDIPPHELMAEDYKSLATRGRLVGLGTIPTSVLIDSRGRVITVRLGGTSNSAVLDSIAVAWIKGKLYRPATKAGTQVAAWVTYALEYSDNLLHLKSIGSESHEEGGPADSDRLVLRDNKPSHDEHPDVLPRFIHFEKAKYPYPVWDPKVVGEVRLAGMVNAQAKLSEVEVAVSSGFPLLDSAALVAAWKHEFIAGTTGGKAVSAWISWTVDFAPGSRSILGPSEKGGTIAGPKITGTSGGEVQQVSGLQNFTGTVKMRLLINAKGAIEKLEITRSSGHAELDSAAVKKARAHTFVPAMQDGKPMSFWTNYSVEFSDKK